MKNSKKIPQKIENIATKCDLVISLLDICPKEIKAGYQRDICMPLFTDVHNS